MPKKTGVHDEAGRGCSCCSAGLQAAYAAAKRMGLSRRNLILGAGAGAIGAWASSARTARAQESAESAAPKYAPASELVVLPVLAYSVPQRQEQRSWRNWGGIQTEAQANDEVKRINTELSELVAKYGLSLKVLPVAKVLTPEQAANVKKTDCDVMLVYASGGYLLDKIVSPDRPTVFFLRHRSGPVSLHYEVLHPRFFRQNADAYADTGVSIDDVVIDNYDDLAWRLRALAGLRKTLGTRIVALGGAGGWGAGNKLAPPIARDKWHLDIREVTYDDLGKRIASIRKDSKAVADAEKQMADYLAQPEVTLHTDKKTVENAFLLYRVFKDYMAEHEARAFTIGGCMVTVIPIAETTACLPLMLLNDEGYLAFCESDFVVIPSGILMHHMTGTPPFLNDPTWPHHGIVTLAHCTAPSRMDGKTRERTKVYTHFESDYGAAPKVEMTNGQVVTNVIPDFACRKWVGARGTIEGSPFHDICRAQIDVAIEGDWEKLVRDMQGFHWMTIYGDCMKEVGYAIRHLGIEWEDVSA